MKTMTSTMVVMMAVAAILGCGMVTPAEGSGRALLGLGELIDRLIDCPPPPSEDPAPEPYGAPYGTSPGSVFSPEPAVYEPTAPAYESPPPYASPSPVDESPAPVYEPSPEYQIPPAGGY